MLDVPLLLPNPPCFLTELILRPLLKYDKLSYSSDFKFDVQQINCYPWTINAINPGKKINKRKLLEKQGTIYFPCTTHTCGCDAPGDN
jgi:hypothetical protein